MITIITIFSVITVAVVALFVIAYIDAWSDVKNRPREPMEWCHIHGPFRRGHSLPFFGTTICPRCYKDALQKAEAEKYQ